MQTANQPNDAGPQDRAPRQNQLVTSPAEALAHCSVRVCGDPGRDPPSAGRALPAAYQPISTSRSCTTNCTLAPTGRQTLVGTCPKGRPVSTGTVHTLRNFDTTAFML